MLVSSRRNYKPADPLADFLKKLPRGGHSGAPSGPGSEVDADAAAAQTRARLDPDFERGTQWVGIGRRKSESCVWDNRSSMNRTGGTTTTRTRNAVNSTGSSCGVPLLTPSELLLPRHKTELEPNEFHYIANCYQKFYGRKVRRSAPHFPRVSLPLNWTRGGYLLH